MPDVKSAMVSFPMVPANTNVSAPAPPVMVWLPELLMSVSLPVVPVSVVMGDAGKVEPLATMLLSSERLAWKPKDVVRSTERSVCLMFPA